MSDDRGRWRLTYEGTKDARGAFTADTGFYLSPEYVALADKAERLPDPEPDWQPGDIAAHRRSDGWTVAYEHILPDSYGRAWYRIGDGKLLHDREVSRPLVRLVPEGQS